MNSTLKAVVSAMAGVIAAGLALRYAGNVPLLADARKGFGGSAK